MVSQIGGDEVDVQLQGVGPGVLHHLRIARPTAGADAVEAGDDGDLHGELGLLDEFEIGFRAGVILVGIGKIGERLGEALGADFMHPRHLDLVVGDLLLEERGEDHGGRARRLQPHERLHPVGQRTGGDHQGVFQGQSQVLGSQVGGHAFTSFVCGLLLLPFPSLSIDRSTPANCS